MNTTSRAFVFVLALAFLSCGTAASSEMEHTKSFAISGFGSYQAYDMSDVNRAMHGALTSFSGARADKDELRGAAGFGGGIRIWPSDRAFLSLEYQRLPASNSGSGQYAGSTYTVDLDVPGSSLALSLGAVLASRSRFRLGLAGGGGYYVCTGAMVVRGPGVNDRYDLEGSGFGAHGLVLVLARLAGNVSLETGAGYRYAKTTDVTSQGSRVRNQDGSLARIDWSGVTGRIGLTYRVAGQK